MERKDVEEEEAEIKKEELVGASMIYTEISKTVD